MSEQVETLNSGGFRRGFKWRMIGTASPVFPGFEIDILDRVPDDEKPDAVWHRERARAILRAHPEVKDLFGHSLWSVIPCLLAPALQLTLAGATSHFSWWVAIIVAFLIGGPLNIALYQLAHECDHCLVFKKSIWNRYLFTITSLPLFLSGHHTWWLEHIAHHNDMSATKDFVTRRRSFFLSTRKTSPLFFPYALFMLISQFLRSAFGLLCYLFTSLLRFRLEPTDFTLAVLADEHLVSGYKKDNIAKWAVVYPAMSFLMIGGLIWYGAVFGQSWWLPIMYLTVAQLFFTGFLHPYNLGWVLGISHFHGRSNYQPTASHYGWFINLTTFNAGLHVEHHDIMGIPWFRLWRLRKIAPEFYDDLEKIDSYTSLGLKFVLADAEMFEDNFNTETHRNIERFSSRELEAEPTKQRA